MAEGVASVEVVLESATVVWTGVASAFVEVALPSACGKLSFPCESHVMSTLRSVQSWLEASLVLATE